MEGLLKLVRDPGALGSQSAHSAVAFGIKNHSGSDSLSSICPFFCLRSVRPISVPVPARAQEKFELGHLIFSQ